MEHKDNGRSSSYGCQDTPAMCSLPLMEGNFTEVSDW